MTSACATGWPVSDAGATVAALLQDLHNVRALVADGALGAAGEKLTTHHQQLEALIAAGPATADIPALEQLQREHHQLLSELSRQRDDAGDQVRTNRQSVRVARAYQQAETLE